MQLLFAIESEPHVAVLIALAFQYSTMCLVSSQVLHGNGADHLLTFEHHL